MSSSRWRELENTFGVTADIAGASDKRAFLPVYDVPREFAVPTKRCQRMSAFRGKADIKVEREERSNGPLEPCLGSHVERHRAECLTIRAAKLADGLLIFSARALFISASFCALRQQVADQ